MGNDVMPEAGGLILIDALVLLAAAVIAVPLFKRLGLGIVLGYLAAGVALGPWGFRLFAQPEEVLSIAEFGVVLLLFIIGLELNPARLWTMRRDIFGLGAAQVLLSGILLTLIALFAAGLDLSAALVAGFALALSSTAFGLQMLQERGQLLSAYGQKTLAILLFQDLSIVPLLLALPLIAPYGGGAAQVPGWTAVLQVLAALAGVILAGRFLLNPLFRLLARIDAREVMIAAALLVVFGAAFIMHAAGLSMALGAFLAGVLLAESSFRHQLEADIEPFRALLLGLFFIAVGMSIDLNIIATSWPLIACGVVVVLAVKVFLIWLLARLFGASNADALRIAVTIPQGGEFGFVLFSAAISTLIMDRATANMLAAIVVLTMAATPMLRAGFGRAAQRLSAQGVSPETVSSFDNARPRIIVLGFGRFGQIVAQMLMAEGVELVAIDRDPDRIEAARKYGYSVYYGDATRADILRAAGAETAAVIALCINNRQQMSKAIDAIRQAFPHAAIFCRAADRSHVLELMGKGVEFAIRETFESGIAFGRAALEHVGLATERIAAVEADVRWRDQERMNQQLQAGEMAGVEMLHKRTPRASEQKEEKAE